MEKVLFIVNPIAGGKDKKAILGKVLEGLDRERYEVAVVYTEYAGHARELAEKAEADVVVAIGGDGTQNEVASGLVGTEKKMGIIPCGSGDGLALHLGISRDPGKAVEVLNRGKVVEMDYGLVNGKPFFCTCGVGIDAAVSWRFANAGKRGLKTYIVETAKEWFGFEAERYRIEVDGVTKWNAPAMLVTVGNANQWGNGAKITPRASVSDGMLDVTVIEKVGLLALPGLLWRLMNGSMDKNKHCTCLRGHSIALLREKDGAMHFDGDPYMTGKELKISVVSGALKIYASDSRNLTLI